MALRRGYVYNSEESAQNAVNLVNEHYKDELDGIKSKNWVIYFPFGDKWFINYHDSLEVILGEPVEVEIEEDSF